VRVACEWRRMSSCVCYQLDTDRGRRYVR
jgi:hypothetical protein